MISVILYQMKKLYAIISYLLYKSWVWMKPKDYKKWNIRIFQRVNSFIYQEIVGKITLVFEFFDILVKIINPKIDQLDLADDTIKCFPVYHKSPQIVLSYHLSFPLGPYAMSSPWITFHPKIPVGLCRAHLVYLFAGKSHYEYIRRSVTQRVEKCVFLCTPCLGLCGGNSSVGHISWKLESAWR